MLVSGILIVYTLRVNMSIAVNDMKKDLNWTDEQKGYVLSSFYWGYTIGQIPSNLLTQRYGGKWLFGLSVFIPSILTLFVPLACKFSFSLSLLVRVLIGFFESATFPSVFYFLPIWIPNSEKTLLIPFIFSGMYLGMKILHQYDSYIVPLYDDETLINDYIIDCIVVFMHLNSNNI